MRKDDLSAPVLAAVLANAFGAGAGLHAERTPDGTSTQVYRVRHAGEVFYLRIAEDQQTDLGPESTVHTWLRNAGVCVPEVIHYDPFVPELERSVMVTREIAGGPVTDADDTVTVAEIFRAAGRDLARINSVEVEGFDWIARNGGPEPLRGQRRTYADFVEADGAARCLEHLGFSPAQRDRAESMLAAERAAGPHGSGGLLAHGDLDLPHVFGRNGRYTGIIDFGEIRGTDRWYDLAEFALHSDHPLSDAAYRNMHAGYAEIHPLPPDYADRIRNTGAMVILHRLDRWLRRDGAAAARQRFFAWNRKRLGDLLDGV